MIRANSGDQARRHDYKSSDTIFKCMKDFPRPTVLVSRCLEFDNVRYDGKVIHSKIVQDLMPYVDFVKVCPEVEIGLGVPRDTLRIVRHEGEHRLIQPKTGLDLTLRMNDFANTFLDDLKIVDGFIFKSRSPSVGVIDIKVYAAATPSPVIEKKTGLFASHVIGRYPGYPIEEEDRLRNSRIRHHFLTQLYAFTSFRDMAPSSKEDLVNYHQRNHFLFMSYNYDILSEMSELLDSQREFTEIFREYGLLLKALLRKPGSVDLKLKTFRSLFSTLDGIGPEEKNFFEDMLERYNSNRINEDAVIEVLRSLIWRSQGRESFENTFLYPYPEELKPLAEEKRDKDYWDKKA